VDGVEVGRLLDGSDDAIGHKPDVAGGITQDDALLLQN
jgi:hypothetical protein